MTWLGKDDVILRHRCLQVLRQPMSSLLIFCIKLCMHFSSVSCSEHSPSISSPFIITIICSQKYQDGMVYVPSFIKIGQLVPIILLVADPGQTYLYFLHPVMSHVTKVYLGTANTTTDYKPILKCLIFGLFYFHPTTCFDLSRSSSGVFYELHTSLDPF
jgi:hypothetical protein